jgi:hypothetical protein
MWLELLFKTYVLCVHLNDVNFRLVHTLASSYLNHIRAIPKKKKCFQAAVCTRRDSAISCRPSSTCTRRYCSQCVTAFLCAPCCYDDHRPTSRIRLHIHTLCVIYTLYLCTSYHNVLHCLEKKPPRSPPPTNWIWWNCKHRLKYTNPLQVRRATR